MFSNPKHTNLSGLARGITGAVVSAVVVLALAGCGGGDPEEEFVADANSVCAEFESFSSGQEETFQKQVASGDFDQAADTFEEYGAELKRSVTEISDLERPSGDREAIDAFIQSSEELTELVPGVVDALRESDTATLLSVATRLQEVQGKADRAARQAGLDDCAEAGPATGTTS
jgi:hypothetical protein